jgi:hypothetical protein
MNNKYLGYAPKDIEKQSICINADIREVLYVL